MPQQFKNLANPEIHRRTTAEEIWNDTGGNIDFFVAGCRHRRHHYRRRAGAQAAQAVLRIVAVEPEESPVLSGGQHTPHKIQGIGAGFVPDILDRSVIDEIVKVNGRRRSKPRARWRAWKAFPAAFPRAPRSRRHRDWQRPESAGKTILAIVPSFSERYLSTALFEGI
jgi:cysteine synthase A